MNQLKIHLFILTFLLPNVLLGSCFGFQYSVTEVLNYNESNYHIFTCEIHQTFKRGISNESVAVVKEVYSGQPRDTVYINSGGGTTAGGTKLIPGTSWLIFSVTKDSLLYFATVCDPLSIKIKDVDSVNCGYTNIEYGQAVLDVVQQYRAIQSSKFSGYKKIFAGGRLFAEGRFKKGKASGQWTHYYPRDSSEKRMIKSKIEYQKGVLTGDYLIYLHSEKKNKVNEKRKYKQGLLIRVKIPGAQKTSYRYIGQHNRRVKNKYYDHQSGGLIKVVNALEIDYQSPKDKTPFNDGYYMNRNAEDSSAYNILGKGKYHNGAMVGKWIFFDKQGNVVNRKVFPKKKIDSKKFMIYENDDTPKVRGNYQNDHRVGTWLFYYRGEMTRAIEYDSLGNKKMKTRFSSSGYKTITYYLANNKSKTISYDKNGQKYLVENYENDQRHGLSTSYDKEGNVIEKIMYVDSRENTILPKKDQPIYINGYLNGKQVSYDPKTKKKTKEGNYWNGYHFGIWISYGKNGSYTKTYYSSNKQALMYQCSEIGWLKTESFDKDHNLIRSYKW